MKSEDLGTKEKLLTTFDEQMSSAIVILEQTFPGFDDSNGENKFLFSHLYPAAHPLNGFLLTSNMHVEHCTVLGPNAKRNR